MANVKIYTRKHFNESLSNDFYFIKTIFAQVSLKLLFNLDHSCFNWSAMFQTVVCLSCRVFLITVYVISNYCRKRNMDWEDPKFFLNLITGILVLNELQWTDWCWSMSLTTGVFNWLNLSMVVNKFTVHLIVLSSMHIDYRNM